MSAFLFYYCITKYDHSHKFTATGVTICEHLHLAAFILLTCWWLLDKNLTLTLYRAMQQSIQPHCQAISLSSSWSKRSRRFFAVSIQVMGVPNSLKQKRIPSVKVVATPYFFLHQGRSDVDVTHVINAPLRLSLSPPFSHTVIDQKLGSRMRLSHIYF